VSRLTYTEPVASAMGTPADDTFIVTIDGPAGSGKTTVSRQVATRLGFDYVDTGALYRGVACAAVEAKIALDDDAALKRLCNTIDIRLIRRDDGLRLMVNGEDVSDKIRTPEMAMAASAVSARPVVRQFLLKLQRRLGSHRKSVFEGRDMGTVVFPGAAVKLYLDADISVRAERRYRELAGKHKVSLAEVRRDMQLRDKNDATRAVAPLKAAKDAICLDTAGMTIDEVVERIVEIATDAYRKK